MAEAPHSPLECGRCRTALPRQSFNTPGPAACPSCGVTVYAAVFPAYARGPETAGPPEPVAAEGEAGCFYHPSRRALIACEACGRFLCSLCHLDLAGQHLCPACVETGRKTGKLETISRHRVLYDEAALQLALVPLLMWPITVITAPLTLVFVARYWRKPSSLLPRTKGRFVAAAVAAVLQIAAWITVVAMLVTR